MTTTLALRPFVILEAVTKTYEGEQVLNVARFVLHAREKLLIVGTNGSGKSTLLRLLLGISRPDSASGTVQLHDSNCIVGYVPQRGGLYGDLTVANNLQVRRRLYGQGDVDLAKQSYIRDLGLIGFLNKRFRELSGGYQRIASIAAALHVNPNCLILDEPFAGVDPIMRALALEQITQILPRLDLLVIAGPEMGELGLGEDCIRIEKGVPVWRA